MRLRHSRRCIYAVERNDELEDLRRLGENVQMPEEEEPTTFQETGSEKDDIDELFSGVELFQIPPELASKRTTWCSCNDAAVTFDMKDFRIPPELKNAWKASEADYNRTIKGWNSFDAQETDPYSHLYSIRTVREVMITCTVINSLDVHRLDIGIHRSHITFQ